MFVEFENEFDIFRIKPEQFDYSMIVYTPLKNTKKNKKACLCLG